MNKARLGQARFAILAGRGLLITPNQRASKPENCL
jgi:hypothetical protein